MAGTQYKERVVKVFVKVVNRFKARLKPIGYLVPFSVSLLPLLPRIFTQQSWR